jgi:hypothetical protein
MARKGQSGESRISARTSPKITPKTMETAAISMATQAPSSRNGEKMYCGTSTNHGRSATDCADGSPPVQ